MKRMFGCIVMVLGLAVIQATAAEKKNPMDTNGDGKVSKEEFCAQQAKNAEKAGKPFKKENAEKNFAARDVNGDGFLTGAELIQPPKIL